MLDPKEEDKKKLEQGNAIEKIIKLDKKHSNFDIFYHGSE
jgi:hypothetical protein